MIRAPTPRMTIEAPHVDVQPSSQRGMRKGILERLKLETAAEHAEIESATRIMAPELSLIEYRRYLESTFGFYKVAEERLCQAGVWEVLVLPAAERLKLPLLVRDLELLGDTNWAEVETCRTPPPWPSLAEAVGGAYVLEGSTLGGRVISRHIRQRFGDDVPRAFLECYGEKTGENWQSFRAALTRFATSRETADRVVAGAQETFRAFTRWLKRT